MSTAYIGLGSNLGEPLTRLRDAVTALDALPGTRIDRLSSIYRSAAVGPGPQPDYLNAVARLSTTLPARDLLTALLRIEDDQGRVRRERWGPRTLDLDLLLYDQLQCEEPALTLPHPGMGQRNFVLEPLREIAPANFILPDGAELDTLVRHCPRGRLEKTDHQFGERPRDMHGAAGEQ